MINKVDKDGNGVIDFEEFIVLMAGRIKDPEPKDSYRDAFKIFDRELNNEVDAGEIINILQLLNCPKTQEVC